MLLSMFSKELVAASNIPIILSILTQGEEYGYQIIKKVKEYSGGALQWSEPMLYPVLHRLERDGFIVSRWHVLDNGRKRKYYAITPEGRALLTDKQGEWIEMIQLFTKIWNLKPSTS